MKKVHNHLKWIVSTHHLKMSALFTFIVLTFSLVYPAMVLTVSSPSTAEAQSVPEEQVTTVVTGPEPAQPAEEAGGKVISATITNTSQPAPAPKPAPVYDTISIPSINLSARYVTVGLTSAGAIDVHPSLVGWWNGSAQPGTAGAAFLDGHNPGVFSKLPGISVGAQISIKKANGELLNYTVVNIETVDLIGINMRRALSPQGGAEGLNLMTCVGAYNAQTSTTDQRLVVYATRS